MVVETTAIVLSRIKYSDSSLIVKAYTKDLGLKTFIAKGVRGKKKTTAALFQPFSFIDLILYNGKNNNIATYKSGELKAVNNLVFDTGKSAIAMFLAEVINRYIKEQEQNNQVYSFISDNVVELMVATDKKHVNNFTLYFLFNFLEVLGLTPESEAQVNHKFCLVEGCFLPENLCRKPLSLDQTKLFRQLASMKKRAFSKEERRQLIRILIAYLDTQLSVSGKIKSLEVLEELSN